MVFEPGQPRPSAVRHGIVEVRIFPECHIGILAQTAACETGDEYVDIISADIYLPEYAPTDYALQYEALLEATTRNKVAALAEVGYIPDIKMLEQSKTPWCYYMAWSKEFCIGEQYNSVESVKAMYASDYSIKM